MAARSNTTIPRNGRQPAAVQTNKKVDGFILNWAHVQWLTNRFMDLSTTRVERSYEFEIEVHWYSIGGDSEIFFI